MSFTYSDPSNSDSDAVRFLLGDTDSNTALFTDEEIAWALTQNSAPRLAAAVCADSAVAKYARLPTSKTLGESSITYGNLTAKFRELGDNLRIQHRNDASPIPFAPSLDNTMAIAVPLSDVPEV